MSFVSGGQGWKNRLKTWRRLKTVKTSSPRNRLKMWRRLKRWRRRWQKSTEDVKTNEDAEELKTSSQRQKSSASSRRQASSASSTSSASSRRQTSSASSRRQASSASSRLQSIFPALFLHLHGVFIFTSSVDSVLEASSASSRLQAILALSSRHTVHVTINLVNYMHVVEQRTLGIEPGNANLGSLQWPESETWLCNSLGHDQLQRTMITSRWEISNLPQHQLNCKMVK